MTKTVRVRAVTAGDFSMEQDVAVIHSKSTYDTAQTTSRPIKALFISEWFKTSKVAQKKVQSTGQKKKR